MALTKVSQLLFDAITISANSYTDASPNVDLTDAVDFEIGFRLTLNAASDVGATVYMFADPSASDTSFLPATTDAPSDVCDISGQLPYKGHTIQGTYRMDHSAKYVKFRVYNHDGVSITNFSLWATPQK